MIEELRQPITVEMVIQEINRYADSRVPLCRQVGRGGDRADGARLRAHRGGEAAVSGGQGMMNFADIGLANTFAAAGRADGAGAGRAVRHGAARDPVAGPAGVGDRACGAGGARRRGAGFCRVLRRRGQRDRRGAGFLALSGMTALVWGPLLALAWFARAQGVERRRGEDIGAGGAGPPAARLRGMRADEGSG